jgi:molybdate transport system ATP-binding protein
VVVSLQVDVGVRRGTFDLRAELEATPGQTLALLGPNGSGKSTLVLALAGLLRPERGRVSLDGEILDDGGRHAHVAPQARPVGVVFQDLRLFHHLSAVENVAFPLRARGVRRTEARGRAKVLLEELGLAHREDARPRDLSGGEAQRVALARALAGSPRLLLLDEPLSALDVRARSEIRSLLRSILARFEGIRVLVTHDPVEAMTLADRLVLLEEGRVTQVGTPDEIRAAPRTPYAAELVGVNLFVGRLVPLEPGVGQMETAHGDVVVGWPQGASGPVDGAIGLLRPVDVSLHTVRPRAGSARNVVEGVVTGLAREADRVRVRVTGAPPLAAEVTPGSSEALDLREGARVWASFKALEVRVVLP